MTTGEKIKELRKLNKLTQDEFANKIKVSRRSLIDWEHERYQPQLENLKAICNAFNLPLDYFNEDSSAVNPNLVKNENLAPLNNDMADDLESVLLDIAEVEEENKALPNIINNYSSLDYNEIPYTFYKAYLRVSKKCNPFKLISTLFLLLAIGFNIASFVVTDIGFYFFFASFIFLFLFLIFKRIYKERVNSDTLKKVDSLKDKGICLSAMAGLYYKVAADRLKIYDYYDNLIVDCDTDFIYSVALVMDFNDYPDLLPATNNPSAMLGVRIYYNNGASSYIILSYDKDKLGKDVVGLMSIGDKGLLNRFKILFS